jgi:hypothetical protein
MPAIGGTDTADLVARARAELGFLRQLEQPRRVAPPPYLDGSSGYPVWYRAIQLEKFHAGEAILYSRQAISNRLKDLDVTRKKASTEGF